MGQDLASRRSQLEPCFKSEQGRFDLHIATAAWATKPLVAVRTPDIIEWLQKLQKTQAMKNGKRLKRTLSFQSRKHVRNLASAIFTDAISMEICATNPCRDVKLKKTTADRLVERIPEDWPIKPTEQRTIADTLKDDAERWIILFRTGTGLRQGEQWNLHVEDVHLDGPEGPWVNVKFGSKGRPPKNGRPRKVPLFGMALEAAQSWLAHLPTYAPSNPDGLMFPTPCIEKANRSGGRGHAGGALRQAGKYPHAWRIVKEALGERKVWWHLLRHTAATSLLCGWWGRRWSLEEVAKLLGHSSVKVTERYAHLLSSELANIAAESHAWWLSRRSGGGSEGSSNGSSSSGTPPTGAVSPPPAPAAAAGVSEEEILFHALSMSGSSEDEILNDSTGAPQRIRTSDLRLRRPCQDNFRAVSCHDMPERLDFTRISAQ
jgi:integrase